MRLKRSGSIIWRRMASNAPWVPCVGGDGGERRVVAGAHEAVDVVDHVVGRRVEVAHVRPLHQAEAEHVLVDRGRQLELLAERHVERHDGLHRLLEVADAVRARRRVVAEVERPRVAAHGVRASGGR